MGSVVVFAEDFDIGASDVAVYIVVVDDDVAPAVTVLPSAKNNLTIYHIPCLLLVLIHKTHHNTLGKCLKSTPSMKNYQKIFLR